MTQHDMVISNGAGDPVRLDMQAALQALATCSSGPVAPTTTYPGMFWLDTSVPPNGYLRQRNLGNSAWQPVVGAPGPASPQDAVAGVNDTRFLTPHSLAYKQDLMMNLGRNRFVNPAMQINQQFPGDAAYANSTIYIADQWQIVTNVVMSSQRVLSITPRRSPRRLRMTVTTAKPSMAAGDLCQFEQRMEGIRVADFGCGAAGARQIIVRFGFRGPAGTYSMAIRGAGSGRSYIKHFTISAAQANIDTEQAFVIPGDTAAATWPVGNVVAFYFGVNIAAGVNYVTTSEGWVNGSYLGGPGFPTGIATAGLVYELFDCGLYLDLDNSGKAPRWQFPDEAEELKACQRYYVRQAIMYGNNVAGANNWYAFATLPVDLRAAPLVTQVSNIGQGSVFPASGVYDCIMPRMIRESRLSTGAGNGQWFSSILQADARM